MTIAESQDSTDTVITMYEAALTGDMDAFLSCIGEDFLLEEPPFLPYGGLHEGPDGFLALVGEAIKLLDMSTMQLEYVFGEGERVCAVITCELNGIDGRRTILEEWIVRDAKIRWGRVFWFDPLLGGADA